MTEPASRIDNSLGPEPGKPNPGCAPPAGKQAYAPPPPQGYAGQQPYAAAPPPGYAPAPPAQQVWATNKNLVPWITLLLNFVLVGLGHILMGQEKKGVAILIVAGLSWVVICASALVVVGFFLMPLWYVWFVFVLIDGYKTANRMREGYPVHHGECANSVTTWFLAPFMGGIPVFVRGTPNEPPEYRAAIDDVERQRHAYAQQFQQQPPPPPYA